MHLYIKIKQIGIALLFFTFHKSECVIEAMGGCSEDATVVKTSSSATENPNLPIACFKLFAEFQRAVLNTVEELNKSQSRKYDPQIAKNFFLDQYQYMAKFLKENEAYNCNEKSFNELVLEIFKQIYEDSTVSTACSASDLPRRTTNPSIRTSSYPVTLVRPSPTATPVHPSSSPLYISTRETQFNFTEEAAENLRQTAQEHHIPADLLEELISMCKALNGKALDVLDITQVQEIPKVLYKGYMFECGYCMIVYNNTLYVLNVKLHKFSQEDCEQFRKQGWTHLVNPKTAANYYAFDLKDFRLIHHPGLYSKRKLSVDSSRLVFLCDRF